MREKVKRNERFVSEPIRPIAGTFDTGAMARGEPGLPARFVWRKNEYSVTRVVNKWKDTSPCKSGAKEKYVSKHWYKIQTSSGEIMQIYFERRPRPKSQRKSRWWLFSVSNQEG